MATKKHLSNLATFFVMIVSASGCHNEDSDLDPKQKAERSIGNNASTTAYLWVDAVRSCEIIGVANVYECAKNSGNLMDEKTAAIFAEMAIKKRKDYDKACAKNFSLKYCNELWGRAVKIEFRKPPEATLPLLSDSES